MADGIKARLAALESKMHAGAKVVVIWWAEHATRGWHMVATIDGRELTQHTDETDDAFRARVRREGGNHPDTLYVLIRKFGAEAMGHAESTV